MKITKIFSGISTFLKNKKHQRAIKWTLLAFVILNILLAVFYNSRTYPWTSLGNIKASGQTFSAIEKQLDALTTRQGQITVSHQDIIVGLSPVKLGLKVDSKDTLKNIRQERFWVPIINFFKPHHVNIAASVDEKTYNQELAAVKAKFFKPAIDAAIKVNGEQLVITETKDGFELDETKFKNDLIQAFATNSVAFDAPLKVIKPTVFQDQLVETLKTLQPKLNLDIRLKFQAKEHKASSAEIGSWFEGHGTTYSPSSSAIGKSIDSIAKELGMSSVGNKDQAITATANALNKNESLSFELEVPLKVTYKYCTKLRGLDNSALGELVSKASAVYADGRGWKLGGKIRFTKVDNGCDYTLWLSAANQMASFGGVCDADYSCRINNDVVINYDRWRYTTDAWKGGGGSLDDYRTMVINHETGHWLGFGHLNCPGAGQLAPVMQQQSINLQGCKFNPWPTAGEKSTLDKRT